MNKTSLLYWWGFVKDLGIPVPVTHIVPVDHSMMCDAMDGGRPLAPEFVAAMKETANLLGYPVFMRTDLSSGKHEWEKTCFVADESKLLVNIFELALANEMGPCMFGPPYAAFVLRGFLQLETSFVAFSGKMPINKERRYFVRGGEILCHHPYWPEEAFVGHTRDGDWRTKLTELNDETSEEEIELLSGYAKTVGEKIGGCWSVDFAKAKDGTWYLIDMAQGHESYHWEGCPAVNKIKNPA